MVPLVGERNFCGSFEPAWLNVEFAECTAGFQLLAWDLLSGEFWGSSGAHGWGDEQCSSTGVFLLCSEVPVGRSVLGTDSVGPEELLEHRDAQEEGSCCLVVLGS